MLKKIATVFFAAVIGTTLIAASADAKHHDGNKQMTKLSKKSAKTNKKKHKSRHKTSLKHKSNKHSR